MEINLKLLESILKVKILGSKSGTHESLLEHLLRPVTRVDHHEIIEPKTRGYRGRVRRGSIDQ